MRFHFLSLSISTSFLFSAEHLRETQTTAEGKSIMEFLLDESVRYVCGCGCDMGVDVVGMLSVGLVFVFSPIFFRGGRKGEDDKKYDPHTHTHTHTL